MNQYQRGAVVVAAEERHLDGMVRLHARAFAGEFLTLLGPGVLRAFYRFYREHEQGICLVAVDEPAATVLGLVCGGEPELRRRFVQTHAVPLAWACLRASVTYARVRQRLRQHAGRGLARLRRRDRGGAAGRRPPQPRPASSGRWSSLLSICADPDQRGGGIGGLLMESFREESRRRGYTAMRLSVHNDNAAAIGLYRRCGWEVLATTPAGTYFARSTEP